MLTELNIGMISIRRACQKHCKQISKIESESFPTPWTLAEISKFIKDEDVLAFVAETEEEEIVGYMYITRDGPDYYEIINIAVKEEYRRKKVATQMVEQLKKAVFTKANNGLLQAIIVDYNLQAHLFFKDLGFRAVQILTDHYDSDNDNQAYVFEFMHFKGKARFKA